MGLFGRTDDESTYDEAGLRDVEARLARVESALVSLQEQVAVLAAAAAGRPVSPKQAPGGSPTSEPDWLTEVRHLKQNGQAINAIKLYREQTGVGLQEAKDAVDALP